MLNKINEHNLFNWNEENIEKLYSKFKYINNHGTFNCLLSDGEYLFCYHGNINNKFYLLEKKSTNEKNDENSDLNGKIISKSETGNEFGFIVATKKLTNENWKELEIGELIVFKDGKKVFNKK